MAALLAGCASTTVTLSPSPQPPLCSPEDRALVLWAPRWRADQKDVAARESAAAAGLEAFLSTSGCFAGAELRRVAELSPASVRAQPATMPPAARLIGVEVRELGPVLRLLLSAALVEGGTEVRLRLSEYALDSGAELRAYAVHWQHGGAGVVKGVAGLPADLQAALVAGMQPPAAAPRGTPGR